MFKTIPASVAAIAVFASGIAHAQTAPNVAGVWRQQDGSATVRIAQCPQSANWCATVIAEQLKPNDPSLLNQMVAREMRPKGADSWTGQYVVDGQSMKASAKLSRTDVLSFKVCAFAFLCETIKLDRVRS
jgi:uncharacterized protein (DUF2147 family)